jgi:thiol-disulfide isomerase/thioredoxin
MRTPFTALALVACMAWGAPAARAEEGHAKEPPPETAHGETHAAKAEEPKGEGKSEHGKDGEGEAEPKAPSGPSDRYVHKWIPFPPFLGAALPKADGQRTIEPQAGRATVVLFLASWCEPCQRLVPKFRDLEKRYSRLSVDFHYVFTHDTLEDAGGFMKEFGIESGVLGSLEILKTYHNPDLPTIYLGDRHGWLMGRYVKAGPEAVEQLDEVLKYLTAY